MSKDENKTTLVAIVETDVFDAKAYRCECLSCKWKSRRYDRESQAVEIAQKHVCETKNNGKNS